MFNRTGLVRAVSLVAVLAMTFALLVAIESPASSHEAALSQATLPVFRAGLTNPSALQVHEGDMIVTQNGAVIENLEIRGQLLIRADNVVVRNVRVYGALHGIVKVEWGSATLENLDIGHPSYLATSGVVGDNINAKGLDIHHVEDGIKLGSNTVYDSVYIHDLDSPNAKPHGDGIQASGNSNAVVKNSHIDSTGPLGTGNAAIFIKPDFTPISNIRLINNYLNGGNYTIFVHRGPHGAPSGIVIEGNRFGPVGTYGILSNEGEVSWQNNVWAATGQPIDSGGNIDPLPVEQGTRPCKSGTCDSVGFVDSAGRWRLHNALSADASVSTFYYGKPGDVAFMGDWNGDGVATPGLYRRSDGYVYLRYSNTQGVANVTFFFGNPGDYPLIGDFNGDGKDTVSVYRQGESRVYVVNKLGNNGGGLGAAEYSFYFGKPGDKPFVGDFNGNGKDSVGLHRPSTGLVYFRNTLTQGNAHQSFLYGNPGDVIMAGDWDGDGDDTVAVYRPSMSRIYVSLSNSSGFADYTLRVGSYPIAVSWGRR